MIRTKKTHTSARLSPLFIVALTGLTAAATCDARPCSWSIGSIQNGFVPDFDQRRTPGPLVFDGMQFINVPAGLPGNGAAYCSPSAHTNFMAYFANRGFPALMPGGAAVSWQSQNKYETVTAAIAELGVMMQTHPSSGTTCCGTSGMRDYLDLYAPGKFNVSAQSAKQLYAPSIGDLAFCVLAGGYVCPFVGWYTPDGVNQWYKDGGHVITMVGLKGWCPTGDREITVRDPGSGDSNQMTQSAFANNRYTLEPLPGFFADDDGGGGIQVFYQRTHERFLGYGSPGLLNGFRVIVPKAGVTLTPLHPSLSLWRPIQLTGATIPTHSSIGGDFGYSAIVDFDLDIIPGRGFMVGERDVVGGGTIHEVMHVNLLDPAADAEAPEPSTVVYTSPNASIKAIATGRSGELFILDGNTLVLRQHGVQTSTPVPTVLHQARRLGFVDQTDSLVLLSAATNQLAIFNVNDLPAGPTVYPLPSAVGFDGDEFMSISPSDGSIWIRSKNSSSIYKIGLDRTLGAVLEETHTSPLFVGAEGLDVDVRQTREHILLARQGVIADLMKNPSGTWVEDPNSDFAGLAGSGGIRLSRSRTNYDPNIMDGPSYFDVLPTDNSPNEYDCKGDVDADGDVDFTDITGVLMQWGSVEQTAADANADGTVGFGDITEILLNWGDCAD